MSDSASPDGDRAVAPSASSPQAVSPVPASIPSAGEFIRKASNLYHASLAMEDAADREIFARKIEVTCRATADWLTAIASAIEARRAGTEGSGAQHESAVTEGQTPTPDRRST